MHTHRIEKVLVVDDAFALRGPHPVKDIQKAATIQRRQDATTLLSGAAAASSAIPKPHRGLVGRLD